MSDLTDLKRRVEDDPTFVSTGGDRQEDIAIEHVAGLAALKGSGNE